MTFSSFSTTCLLVVIIALICRSSTLESRSIPAESQQSNENFIQNNEEFIPTNEWQIVKEGQAIPPGLHIRLNMETGLREAKFLDNDQQQSSGNLVPVATEKSNVEEEHMKLSKENLERAFANLDLSKDDVVADKTHDEEVRTKFRSYDELKKDFERINVKIQTDQEILSDLIDKLVQTTNDENRKTILTDLEYYLHQYDNAVSFSDKNGLEILGQLLNSSNSSADIRRLIGLVLGAAFQGNPKVQMKAYNLGFVHQLLRLINTESDENVILRLVYALSTLLRHFPQAQANFVELGGTETIVKIVDQSHQNNKLRMRAISLMNDLISEKDRAMVDKSDVYKDIHVRDQLVHRGWCSRITTRLSSIEMDEFEDMEKTLLSMVLLSDVCRSDFISFLPVLDKLHVIFSTKNQDNDSVYVDLHKNIQLLLTKLRQIPLSVDDL